MKKVIHVLAGGVAICSLIAGGNAVAAPAKNKAQNLKKELESTEAHESTRRHKSREGWDLGSGWKLNTTGGLSYVNPQNADYWVKLSGVMRLDETAFMGSYRDKASYSANQTGAVAGATPSSQKIASGALFRLIELYLEGGLGENWEYSLTLSYGGGQSTKASIGDTWLSYMGLLENNQIYVGRVPGNWFGLDNANSGSWNPFLERSMIAHTFYPGDGLGVMTDFWWENGGLTLAAFQPDQKDNRASSVNPGANTTAIYGARDRWAATARATVAPVHNAGDVWHFGVSGAWRETLSSYNGEANTTAIAYTGGPSARSRATVPGDGLLSTGGIQANNARLFNVEAARQIGSFMLEGEYTTAFVHRVNGNLGTLRFDGWNIQARYLLTGEHHAYDVRDGNFGTVVPNAHYGAFEVAARYDFINLNNKDVQGGSEHDVSVGLNWFVNKQLRLSTNYIRASIHPNSSQAKRNLDIVAARLQVRFK